MKQMLNWIRPHPTIRPESQCLYTTVSECCVKQPFEEHHSPDLFTAGAFNTLPLQTAPAMLRGNDFG